MHEGDGAEKGELVTEMALREEGKLGKMALRAESMRERWC